MTARTQKRLYLVVLLLGLLPTIGVFFWGIYQASGSHELRFELFSPMK